MYPFIALLFLCVALVIFLIGKKRDWDEDEVWPVCVIFIALFVMFMGAWGVVYAERWDRQREVEAFVKSEIYVKYEEIITASSDNEIVKLQAVGINVQDLINRINWANCVIQTHTAGE